ncbi:MAG: hypothetical protein J5761_04100 [Paludibacteraceae bacterium]|nr:hypothetical protein [Paludibacteraceae bacterium]
MARVELPCTILAIHGRLGNLIYRSRRQPDGTYKVFVHPAPAPRKPRYPREVEPISREHRSNIER